MANFNVMYWYKASPKITTSARPNMKPIRITWTWEAAGLCFAWTKARTVTYDASCLLSLCVASFLELSALPSASLRRVATP